MGDDLIGVNSIHLIDYDANLDVWRAPKQLTNPDFDRPFNVELLLDNGEGGSYSAFFQVDLFKDNVVKIPPTQ